LICFFQAGKCFHLVPRPLHDDYLPEHQLPELLRTPLEELSLQIKALRLGRIEAFLAKAIQVRKGEGLHFECVCMCV
jgi:ATP-dependent RNA helicase DHX36